MRTPEIVALVKKRPGAGIKFTKVLRWEKFGGSQGLLQWCWNSDTLGELKYTADKALPHYSSFHSYHQSRWDSRLLFQQPARHSRSPQGSLHLGQSRQPFPPSTLILAPNTSILSSLHIQHKYFQCAIFFKWLRVA